MKKSLAEKFEGYVDRAVKGWGWLKAERVWDDKVGQGFIFLKNTANGKEVMLTAYPFSSSFMLIDGNSGKDLEDTTVGQVARKLMQTA